MLRSYIQGWLCLPITTRLGTFFICFGIGMGIVAWFMWQRDAHLASAPVAIKLRKEEALGSETTEPIVKEIVVGIVGSIRKPGIYTVLEGSRVADVIATAGGVIQRMNEEDPLIGMNIAKFVFDGETIVVNGTLTQSTEQSDLPNKIRINSSSKTEIDMIPGIGEKYAEELLQKRPFISLQDMQEKTNIPDKLLSKIDDYISYEND